MRTLQVVANIAGEDPQRIFHVSGERTSTYGELARRSDAVAALVSREGGPRQRPVAVIGHKEPEMIQAFLGCLKAGHPYVPIESSMPQGRIEAILGNLPQPLVLTPERVASLSDERVECEMVGNEEIAYVIFTSGSTGEPKGVPIQARSLEFFTDWIETEQKLGENEVFLNQAPFCFDLSVMDLFPCLRCGGKLVSVTKALLTDLTALSALLTNHGLTTWVSTPSFARLCAGNPEFHGQNLMELRRFLFCGETLPPAVAATLLERFPAAQVWNTYGPTEATVATSSVLITPDWIATGELPVGEPTPGCRIRILNDELHDVATGERGQIVISGPNVSPGYLNPRPNEQPFREIDGVWSYCTGDWGHFDGTQLYFDGRMDSQIKLNGYRIELGDLEANLRSLEQVRDAVVLTNLEDGTVTSLTACIIYSGESASPTERILTLRGALRKKLPDYMLPRNFRFFDEFPMTINGKVDRRKLAELT
ncbi:MAG: D-alanine--poly(phosphoribitol) ligase subunit DltA [Chthoniobacterales bacterium]